MDEDARPAAAADASSRSNAEPTNLFGTLRRGCFIVAAFGCLLIPGILQAGVVPQEMGSILKDFEINEQDFGMLAGGIAAAASVLALTAIWLAPRVGVYRVCMIGYGLFALGLGTAALFPYGKLALVMGTLTALGLAYLHLGNGLVVQLAPHRAGTMTNLLHGINSLGKAIGPLFARIGTSWRHPFLTISGLGLVLGLIGLLGKAPAKRQDAIGSAGKDAAPPPAEEPLEGPAREALRQPFFWLCGLLFIPIVGMEQVVVIWLPQYLKHPGQYGPVDGKEIALTAASIILWTELLARFAASWLLTRVSPVALLALCVPCSAAVLLGTECGWWTGAHGTLAMVLCGIAFATPWPTFFALASRYFPRHHGLLAVLSGAATSLAIIASYMLGGMVGKQVGFEWTLRISPLLGIGIVLGAIFIQKMGAVRIMSDPTQK
ncbi:MAG: MFS transporter [Planctomycetes bacterium]|nr:MFS transporter [Planctomycetota bacterium]